MLSNLSRRYVYWYVHTPSILNKRIQHIINKGLISVDRTQDSADCTEAVSYTHLDVYKRQGERPAPAKKIPA